MFLLATLSSFYHLLGARHAVEYACSKVDSCPEPAHECVGNLTSSTGPDDVLQVGLEDQSAPEKPEAVGQLERRFMSLHSDGGIRLLREQLRDLQIIAEVTGNDAEAASVRRPPREKTADEEPSCVKEPPLTSGLAGIYENRPPHPHTPFPTTLY